MKSHKADITITQNIKYNNGTVAGVVEGNISLNTVPEASEDKMQISWLHLSDLHLGRDIYNETVVVDKLLIDIEEQISCNQVVLDFIFITGDLTFSGQKDEFEYAADFINKLSQACHVSKDNIIIVPGNHDVTRSTTTTKSLRNNIKNREEVSLIIGTENERAKYSIGLYNYRKFLCENFEWARKCKENSLSYTINRKINNISVSILALNTAWLSYGGENEKGRIILGERQVREALAEVENPQIIIALMHHPFEWLEWFDVQDVQGMLERRVDFILNGHEHRLDIIGKGSIFGKAFKISAGSTYESRNHFNSYNIVCSNLIEKNMTCYLRRFEDKHGGFWSQDNSIDHSITNGRIKVKLSDRLSEILTDDLQMSENPKDEYWVTPSDSDIQIMVPSIPKELIRQIKNGKCILFAGAGASLDAGLPSWSELLRTMVEKINDYGLLIDSQRTEIDYLLCNQEFTAIAEFCKEKLGPFDFAEIIRECLNSTNRISQTHNILSQIPFKAAVTTNYDNLIEKNHRNYRVVLPNEISELDKYDLDSFFQQDFFPIFKIHGSYEKADSIILTDRDYRNAIFKNLKYRENIKKLFEDKSLLFIGFSFRDPSVNLLLQEILTLSEGRTRSHYAIMNDIGEIKKDFLWKSMNLRVVSYPTIDNSHIVLINMLKALKEALKDEFRN